jgi:hypothetical protein
MEMKDSGTHEPAVRKKEKFLSIVQVGDREVKGFGDSGVTKKIMLTHEPMVK